MDITSDMSSALKVGADDGQRTSGKRKERVMVDILHRVAHSLWLIIGVLYLYRAIKGE